MQSHKKILPAVDHPLNIKLFCGDNFKRRKLFCRNFTKRQFKIIPKDTATVSFFCREITKNSRIPHNNRKVCKACLDGRQTQSFYGRPENKKVRCLIKRDKSLLWYSIVHFYVRGFVFFI